MKNKRGKLFWIIFIPFLFTGCFNSGVVPPVVDKGTSWTVMVFMNGDNDLYKYAWRDFNSLEKVGSTDQVKVIVQFDSLGGEAARYLVKKDAFPNLVTSPVLEYLGEVNMGDALELADFVRFCAENFPADKYALIIWDHGTGFKNKDISFDFSPEDAITIPELGMALSLSTMYLGKKIDFLGMDACLMAMMEVAYEVKNHARVMVTSQELVPGEGWNYEAILRGLVSRPTMGERDLARLVVNSYIDYYPVGSFTQSAIDLGGISSLGKALDELSRDILNDSLTSPLVYLSLGDSAVFFGDADYVDLGSLVSLFSQDSRVKSEEVRESARLVQERLERCVIYERASGEMAGNARGLSIYFPYFPYNSKYDDLAFSRDTHWDEMIKYLSQWRR